MPHCLEAVREISAVKYATFFLACAGLLLSTQALAVDPFEDFHEYGELSEEEIHALHEGEFLYGDVEFGALLNRGNTSNTAFKLKSNLYQDFKYWRNQFKFDGAYRREVDPDTNIEDETASRYFISAQGNYKIGQKNTSLFLYGDYELDKFNGREYTTTFVIGYGKRVFEGRKNTVDLDIGPGLSMYRRDDETELEPEQERVERGHLLRAALQWERTVSKRTRFNQDISYERSVSGLGARIFSETALISQVMGGVSMKVAYTYRYHSQPEEGKEKVDSEIGVTLVYSFN